ncbi:MULTISPECIES: DNA double-strand break repair protein Mre11 [Haloferax]|uniref:DNA double-strand break repair protein Mre11 n=1 Tax=Haloferax massiliensis TaxID=1476858 RepID=A0A0D6JST3_9EURY|nr:MULTISPECIES: DNA double-strand break repair protein Mre11 [Haloferax]MDS0240544.1 exonuclease SbcCD subunit D [Haloferax sp. S2CR25]MDS0443665.1 exonuclease SbcCD subunit D [Haloferax sp. S2CR25-2]CQR50665.1 Calcineurin-like phosphoesterase superfamily domain protein [Haloferax massiliensis]
MTRVIHTGDTHIGYQQYHSPERRQDFLDAFERVVADALDGDVDAVVHAGDLYHDRRPELPDLLGTLAALRRLDDAGIPFLAIVGNHESTRGGQWLDLFERLGLATRLGRDPHVVGDVAFYGLDHVPRSRRDELDYRFEPADAGRAVLVAHGLFTPFAHADWETETVLDESNVDFDAVLLGDNHVPDTADLDGTWVTYCGSTERASASERDPRGYNLVEFTPDAVDIRRRTLETRPFAFVEVDLAGDEGIERVRQRVREFDVEDAVVIVELRGEGDAVTPAAVESFAVEEGALVARVNDKRDIDDDAELAADVTFADPDDAVRERVREMGLSSAALDVDETVRASKVADSNVRDEVRERVESLLSEDPDAFVAAESEGEGESGDSADTAVAEDVEAAEDAAETEPEPEATTDTDSELADADATTDTDSETTAEPDSESAADPVASRDSSLGDFA